VAGSMKITSAGYESGGGALRKKTNAIDTYIRHSSAVFFKIPLDDAKCEHEILSSVEFQYSRTAESVSGSSFQRLIPH